MHEFSVVNQVVDSIVETALNRGAKRIRGIELLVGEMNLLGEEQLIFWLKEILKSRGEIGRDVKIDLKPIPGRELVLNRIEIDT